MQATDLRAEFPVLERVAYLNAGTTGPLPRAAADALRDVLDRGLRDGRATPYFETLKTAGADLRAAYAHLLGARVEDLAITSSTSDGIVRVLAGLRLDAGGEVITSEHEHPGLLGPLAAARRLLGVSVRAVPLRDVADAVGPRTRLIACSHVSWVTGEVAPAGLRDAGVPVLFDGAQGAGAIDVRVPDLGCSFYAGSGQKWLCGPMGVGLLWVDPADAGRVATPAPTFGNLTEPARGLDAEPYADARRLDAPAIPPELVCGALAATAVLERHGWPSVHARARDLAQLLASRLRERGFEVVPRDATTLVSFRVDEPAAARDRLAAADVVVRDLPGHPYLRASVGAWNDESDLERLLEAIGPAPAPTG